MLHRHHRRVHARADAADVEHAVGQQAALRVVQLVLVGAGVVAHRAARRANPHRVAVDEDAAQDAQRGGLHAGPEFGVAEELAEDRDVVLSQARSKLPSFDMARLQEAVERYGNMATRKRFQKWIDG